MDATTRYLNNTLPRVTLVFVLCLVSIHGQAGEVQKDWPFYIPEPVHVPDVSSENLVQNDIDRFVAHKLETHQTTMSQPASRRTLIRRLYFDLIGLPPTPAEIHAFVHDDADDAYEKLVDRLLDDSRYGERWARYWLDLARYADTAGYEGDPDLPHAWRYRDYVIDAFNSDKPYDQFIKEQLAGDEFKDIMGAGDLPGAPPENTVALTFLRLAPFTEPRGDETRHEMLSEMTSTVGSVFLGLTVGCAKCHDHKHDDIPTSDFYRMKAFFATVQIPRPEPGDIYQIGGPIAAKFYRDREQDWAAEQRKKYEQQRNSAKDKLASLKQNIAQRLGIQVSGGFGFGIQSVTPAGNDYAFETVSKRDDELHIGIVQSNGDSWSIFHDGVASDLEKLSGENDGKWFAAIQNPQHISLGMHTAGSGEAKGGQHEGNFAEVMIYDHVLDDQEREQIHEYVAFKYRSGGNQTDLPKRGLRFWLDAEDLDANDDTPNAPKGDKVVRWVDKVAGIALQQDNASSQPTIAKHGDSTVVAFDESFLRGDIQRASFLQDSQGAIVVVYTAKHNQEGYGFEVGGGGSFLSTFVNPKARGADDPIADLVRSDDARITIEERREYEFLSTRDRYVKQHLKRLQPVAMSLRHSYGPPFEPGVPVSRVMVRGEYDHPGEVVEPGFLSAITGNQEPAKIRLDPFKRWPTRSRRMALANWIASSDNPMTARVMVNRLWHWHFGQGIVTTTSDFGYLSGGPSHQELLDWLAIQFVKSKWSVKAIHRLILNSATYRQASNTRNKAAEEFDPDNRLLWRFNRRRLDAEAVRDNVLAVSGRLNPEQFGLPIFPPLPGDVAEAVKYSDSKWDTQYGPEGRKRSLYIYQQRTLTMPLMQTFDSLVCEESRPRRRTSVTSLQALAMYNGEFVNDEAIHFAQRARQVGGEDRSKQIETAFEIALGRRPQPKERSQLLGLMETSDTNQDGLVAVCRVLLNTNEFLYID